MPWWVGALTPRCSRAHYSRCGGETPKRKRLIRRLFGLHETCVQRTPCYPSCRQAACCEGVRHQVTPFSVLKMNRRVALGEETESCRGLEMSCSLSGGKKIKKENNPSLNRVTPPVICYEHRRSNMMTRTQRVLVLCSNYKRNLCPSFLYCRYF